MDYQALQFGAYVVGAAVTVGLSWGIVKSTSKRVGILEKRVNAAFSKITEVKEEMLRDYTPKSDLKELKTDIKDMFENFQKSIEKSMAKIEEKVDKKD